MKYWREKLICQWKGHDNFIFDPFEFDYGRHVGVDQTIYCFRCGHTSRFAIVCDTVTQEVKTLDIPLWVSR